MEEDKVQKLNIALTVLHELFGGRSWDIELGDPVYVSDSSEFFTPLTVNGKKIKASSLKEV